MAKTTPPVRVGASRPRSNRGGSPRPAASSVAPLKQRGSGKKLPAPTVPKGQAGGRPGAAANRAAHRQGTAGAPRSARGIRVMATQVGYYANERKRPSDVFVIRSEEDFSPKWMERVDKGAPIRTTTPNQAIAQRHDEILEQKAADAGHTSGEARGSGGAVLEDDDQE